MFCSVSSVKLTLFAYISAFISNILINNLNKFFKFFYLVSFVFLNTSQNPEFLLFMSSKTLFDLGPESHYSSCVKFGGVKFGSDFS